ncbi:AraC family transcriptional regulator [Shewanella waksmanii]|uniref:AraC family transcriptional regulator n=1 Tax=Shewanella waksmanii TaxID=213783 RepID=UPI0037353C7E
MAVIQVNTRFNPDSISNCVVGIAADVGQHDSGVHQHKKGQLLFASHGCISFALSSEMYVLPPTKAVWIPPNTAHQAKMTNVVGYRSVYFDCNKFTTPKNITMIEVDGLLKALIDKMALWPWDTPEPLMHNTTALFWEEFNGAKQHSFQLPIPDNRRLTKFRQQLLQADFKVPSITTLAKTVGASPKTITRIFKAQTGMSYQDWKLQWRLLKAIELLSQAMPVGEVAHRLDFCSDSAFIAFFKKQTGQTPLYFIKQQHS